MDRWSSYPVVCKGGLDLFTDVLTQGTQIPGVATVLQNFEPALEGGYERILGYQKWDSNEVTGDTGNPVLGVKVAFNGVLAVRRSASGDNALYFSSGTGWAKVSTAARNGSVNKARMIKYSISGERIVLCDGVNPALKYDGTTDTLINGTGAPADPKYATEHLNRLVLAGYSAKNYAISISAPNTDTDYSGANGAIELNVGDVVVGLSSFRNTLYIFCENSIHKLVGNTSADFTIQEVTNSIGCLSHDSIQEVGGDVMFLAPDGLRSIAATERIDDIELGLLSKQIQPLVRPLIGVLTEDDYSSCVVRAKSQYRLFLNQAGTSDDDKAGFLGRLEGRTSEGIGYSWATLKGISAYCSDSEYEDDDEIIVHGHPDNGYVYRQEIGSSFDGANISHIYRTPEFFFSDPELRKVLYKVRIFTQSSGALATNLRLEYDPGDTRTRSPASAFVIEDTTAAAVYGTAIYGTDTYAGLSKPTLEKQLTGSGRSVYFEFANSGTSPSFRIDSFVIQYALKGRR